MLINFIYFLMCVFSVFGLFCEKPCEVCPEYPGGIPISDNFTTTVNVPEECMNGTFRWHSPAGHTMMHFQNVTEMKRICIKNISPYTDYNITFTATNQRLGTFDKENLACFNTTSGRDIVLQVTANPSRRYLEMFEYRIYK
ncbi:uncharacterized protein LOC132750197 isoform X2 [Ruditapes philippinarum]|uniref:uncharacterized protein LOC132750197 isoform X2 n=1 Tax=Ruditapes philippinarum TaxID=129788 RepID=UPI00295BE423|nr:uncharacterized protein LOC132750197 isoform X2 [Ruditapes philippinarum]